MAEAYICDFARTPIGRYGGASKDVRADDLAAHPAARAARAQPSGDWAALDDVILGCANQAGEDNRNVARMAGLLAGLPVEVPGATVNRLCGSGLDAVGTAARAIRAGRGGADAGRRRREHDARAVRHARKADEAFSRTAEIYDTTIGWRFVNPPMQAKYGIDSMPETGENVAEEFQMSRADQDAFAWRSQQRAEAARRRAASSPARSRRSTIAGPQGRQRGRHRRASAPRDHAGGAGEAARRRSARRRHGDRRQRLGRQRRRGGAARWPPRRRRKRHGLTPRARVVAMATAGVAPRIMGIGPGAGDAQAAGTRRADASAIST